jgi:hypothetical protein
VPAFRDLSFTGFDRSTRFPRRFSDQSFLNPTVSDGGVMSNVLSIVGGRMQATSDDSKAPLQLLLAWGRQTSNEVYVGQGYGDSPWYGPDSYLYQSLFFDTVPGPDYVVGGRIRATFRYSVMPMIEVSRWGVQTGTEVTVFYCYGWTSTYGDSIITASYFLAPEPGDSTPRGGVLQATNLTSTEPLVTLSSWGTSTPYPAGAANGYGWRSDQNTRGYLYQTVYVETLDALGLQGVVSYPTPIPFPTFDAGQQPAAFAYVNQQLTARNVLTAGQPDTRALIAYCATAENNYDTSLLATAISDINILDPPAGVGQQDWDAVVDQLELELVAAQRVIPVYGANNKFMTDVYLTDLTNILKDADQIEVDPDDSVEFNILNILAGAAEIVASVSGPETAAAAWVVSSVVSTVVAEVEANSGQPSVTTTEGELEGELNTQFNAAIAQNDVVLNRVVSDWGKLAAVNKLCAEGLVWPDKTSDFETALETAYEVYIWQCLLPIKYAVIVPGLYSTPPGPPCQWTVPGTSIDEWLGWAHGLTHGASKDICNKLFGTGEGRLGVPMADVFNGQNGWNLDKINDGNP